LASRVHRNPVSVENVYRLDSRLARLELEIKHLQEDVTKAFELVRDLTVAYDSKDIAAFAGRHAEVGDASSRLRTGLQASLTSALTAARLRARGAAEIAVERTLTEVMQELDRASVLGSEATAIKATAAEACGDTKHTAIEEKSQCLLSYTSVGSGQTDPLEPPQVGDIVHLGANAPSEYQRHLGVITQIDGGDCAIAVLDEDLRIGVGECWQSLLDITEHSRCLRVGSRVVVGGFRGQRNAHFNGLSGIVAAHPREGHPTFIRKSSCPNRPRFTVCVQFDDPAVAGEDIALLEPRFLSSEDAPAQPLAQRATLPSRGSSISAQSMVIADKHVASDNYSPIADVWPRVVQPVNVDLVYGGLADDDEDDCIVELITSSSAHDGAKCNAEIEAEAIGETSDDRRNNRLSESSLQELANRSSCQKLGPPTPLPESKSAFLTPPPRRPSAQLVAGSANLTQVGGVIVSSDVCPSQQNSFVTNETRTVSPSRSSSLGGLPAGLMPTELQMRLAEGQIHCGVRAWNEKEFQNSSSQQKLAQLDQMTNNLLQIGPFRRSSSPVVGPSRRSSLPTGPARASSPVNSRARFSPPPSSTARTSSPVAAKDSARHCEGVTISRSQSVPGLRVASAGETAGMMPVGGSFLPPPSNTMKVSVFSDAQCFRESQVPTLQLKKESGSFLPGSVRVPAGGSQQLSAATPLQSTRTRQARLETNFQTIPGMTPSQMWRSSMGVLAGSAALDQASLQPAWCTSSVVRLSSAPAPRVQRH